MQDRKLHILEEKLFKIMHSKVSDKEKNIALQGCLSEIKECKDTPAPSIDTAELNTDEADTAIIWAAYYGNSLCLDTLIAARANFNKEDLRRDTALSWAVFNQHMACVQQLLEAKADFIIKDHKQRTLLDTLFVNEKIKPEMLALVRYLLEQNVVLNTEIDKAIQFLRESDKNNPDRYIALSILCMHYKEQANVAITAEQYATISAILAETPVPASIKQMNADLFSTIDISLNTAKLFPTVLTQMITKYDNLFFHPQTVFRAVEIKNTPDESKSKDRQMALMKK